MSQNKGTMIVKIGKREARKRYNAGLPIVMAGEPDWFDNGPRVYLYASLVTAETHGDFDALVALSDDTRYRTSRVSYGRPVDD